MSEDKMRIEDYMLMRPEITESLIKEAVSHMHTKVVPFISEYIILCAKDENFEKKFILKENTKEGREELFYSIINFLKTLGKIKEIDVRESDDTIRFWIQDVEYAFIPYEKGE
jgi:hypothetical protein